MLGVHSELALIRNRNAIQNQDLMKHKSAEAIKLKNTEIIISPETFNPNECHCILHLNYMA